MGYALFLMPFIPVLILQRHHSGSIVSMHVGSMVQTKNNEDPFVSTECTRDRCTSIVYNGLRVVNPNIPHISASVEIP